MRQSRVKAEDAKFEAERRLKHRGTAKVALDAIHLPEEPDRRQVERLKEIFHRGGCRPEHIVNHVLLLIDQPTLENALRASGFPATALLHNVNAGYRELYVPHNCQLVCLHGKHRIQAAREYLSAQHQWWVADLYLADINPEVAQFIVEEYANEANPPDGEVYCKIRRYHFERNLSFEMRWWARLKGNRARNLKALLRHDEMRAAFDALLDLPGLWYGMQLTTIHKMMAMRFDEGILNALDRLRCFWHDLLGGDVEAMGKVDETTVKALELRAPGSSKTDYDTIQRRVRGGELFRALSDQSRAEIMERLTHCKGLIPSLHSFFRNLCFWEPCLDGLRHLITPSRGETVFGALERHFTGINQREGEVVIQVGESAFTTATGSTSDQIEFGNRQLAVFAMRHSVEIPRGPMSEDVSAKPRARADTATLRQYAELATRLGYESPEIDNIKDSSSQLASLSTGTARRPVLVVSGPGEDIQQRCGLPKLKTFEEDRDSLFVNYLDKQYDERGSGITSFYVRQSVYMDFLGLPRRLVASISDESEDPLPAQVSTEEQEREHEQCDREQEDEQQRDQEWRDQQQQEQEQREQEQREQEQREREQREREQREQEQRGLTRGRIGREMVAIRFKVMERNVWRDGHTLWVDPSEPSEVARVARKNMRKGLRSLDTNMQMVAPEDCFEAVTVDGSNTILLVPQEGLNIDDHILDSANVLGYAAKRARAIPE